MKKYVKYRSENVNKTVGRSKRLPREFYARPSVEVARDLLGLFLIHKISDEITAGMITETEAYAGPEDRACHAYNMLRTKRNEAIYGLPGTAYVYLIYGMYHCFNVVTYEKEKPHGVLVRSIEPLLGEEIMHRRRNGRLPLALGPGRLCQAMGIKMEHNKADLVGGSLYIAKPTCWEEMIRGMDILETPRIGIDYAGDAKHYPWRFVLDSRP